MRAYMSVHFVVIFGEQSLLFMFITFADRRQATASGVSHVHFFLVLCCCCCIFVSCALIVVCLLLFVVVWYCLLLFVVDICCRLFFFHMLFFVVIVRCYVETHARKRITNKVQPQWYSVRTRSCALFPFCPNVQRIMFLVVAHDRWSVFTSNPNVLES